MNYTKGQWNNLDLKHIKDLWGEGHYQIVGDSMRCNIALLPTHWDNAEANANLISASPDLYKTCNALIDYLSDPRSCDLSEDDIWLMATNAVHKAEGKEV